MVIIKQQSKTMQSLKKIIRSSNLKLVQNLGPAFRSIPSLRERETTAIGASLITLLPRLKFANSHPNNNHKKNFSF